MDYILGMIRITDYDPAWIGKVQLTYLYGRPTEYFFQLVYR